MHGVPKEAKWLARQDRRTLTGHTFHSQGQKRKYAHQKGDGSVQKAREQKYHSKWKLRLAWHLQVGVPCLLDFKYLQSMGQIIPMITMMAQGYHQCLLSLNNLITPDMTPTTFLKFCFLLKCHSVGRETRD